jgi:hypothetical protein
VKPTVPRRPITSPLLTPAQVKALRDKVKASGFGQQGRTRSAPEAALALLQVDQLVKLGQELQPSTGVQRTLSYDAAVKFTAKHQMISPTRLRRARETFVQTGELVPPEPKRMKPDNPLHANFGDYGPSLAVQTAVHQYVDDAAKENTYISTRTIVEHAAATTEEWIPKRTMSCWLGQMNILYGEKKLSGLHKRYADAMTRRYILEYSRLKREEELGHLVLVWMDESYIHAGYCSRWSWFHASSDIVPNRVKGSDKGKRLIIIHAMSRTGMLEKADVDPSDELGEKFPSAAIVTSKLSAADECEPADYHDTMDGEKFLQWMRNRLFPAFHAKFGRRKKMALILDNAKYHHARGEDWISPSKMTALECGVYLRKIGVPEVVAEDGRRWPAAKFTAGGRNGGPTGALLKSVLSSYIKSHPAINTTLVEQEMTRHGHSLLYTPPYESWIQPIELVWAQVKRRVAMQSSNARKWQQTADQTKAALSEMTSEACLDIIQHTEKLMDEWLKTPAAGSLSRFSSLSELGRLSQRERESITDLNLPDSILTGEADEDKENEDPMQE